MYIVIGMVGRTLGNVITCTDWDDALSTAVDLCREQMDDTEFNEEYVKGVLIEDNDFWHGPADEGWAVYIGVAEQKKMKRD